MKAVFIAAADGYVAADGKPSGWLAVWVQHQRAVTTLSRMLRLNPAARSMTPSPSSEPADQRLERLALEARRDGRN